VQTSANYSASAKVLEPVRGTWAHCGHNFGHSEIGVLVSALFCFELGMVPGGGRTSAAVAMTYVADSTIDRIAQIATTDIFRHNLGTKHI
jgi:hypothetical protein